MPFQSDKSRLLVTFIFCLGCLLLVSGCDRRKYNTNVYESDAQGADNLLSDPANITDGTTNSTEGGTSDGTADGTATGGNAINPAAGQGDNTNNGAAGGASDSAESAGQGETSDSADNNAPTVDSSSALESTVTGPDAAAEPNSIDAASGESGEPGEVGEAGPAVPAVEPVAIPPAVPQGPDVDRIGSSSIYQPFADEETATYTIDGRRSQALAAVGGPVLESPRALMEEIDEYFLNDANQVAYSGRFSVSNENSYAVWTGDASNPVQIFETGTAIPGLPEGQTYFKTLKLALGDDGSLAQLVEVQEDATITQAYLVSRGARHDALMQTSTSLPGLFGSVKIDAIEVVDRSSSASALVSVERIVTIIPAEPLIGATVDEEDEPDDIEVITRQYSVWYHAGATPRAIVHSWIEDNQGAPALANGCRIYAPDNKVDNLRLGVTDNAQLVFQAQVGGDGGCESGRAVMRFNGSGYQEIVKDGDAIPGVSSHIFNDVSLYSVADDGSAVVFANLITPEALEQARADEQAQLDAEDTGLTAPTDEEQEAQVDDGQWSFWIMPPQGGARLLALEGEEVQIGRTVSVLSGEPRNLFLQINASNQIALKLLLEDAEQPVFFVGMGHAGQPHGSLETPGASALRYAFTGNSALPGQNADAVLGSLGEPHVTPLGELVLYGEVTPSQEAEEAAEEAGVNSTDEIVLVKPYNSIWQIDAEGRMRELVRSGDEVAVAGVNKELASLSVAGQIARPGTSGVRINSAGAMLMRATIERKFGNSVLLYIAP